MWFNKRGPLASALLTLPLAAIASFVISDVQPAFAEKQKRTERAELTVEVTHLRNAKGRVAIALFNTEKTFPEQEKALAGKLAKIAGKRAKVTFKGLEPGVYAVAVLHDENKNDEMDFNLVGMPLEGYGFSRNASAMFGPPDFEDAALKLPSGKSKTSIKTRYFSL